MPEKIKNSMLFIGGNICYKMMIQKKLDNYFSISGSMWNVSPLSISEKKTDTSLQGDYSDDILTDANKNFDNYLENHKSDWIVIEMTRAGTALVSRDGVYYTAHRLKDVDFCLPENGDTIYPKRKSPETFHQQINNFAEDILKFYPSDHIVLIRDTKSGYFIQDSQFKEWKSENYNKWINTIEDYFIQKTSCYVLDISKYYYSVYDDNSYPWDYSYENEYYNNTAYALNLLINSGNKEFLVKPSVYFSAKRYEEYASFKNKKPFSVFLNSYKTLKYWLKNFSPEILRQYHIIFKRLMDMNISGYSEAMDYLKKHYADEKVLYDMFSVALAIENKDYFNLNIKYCSLLKYKTGISKSLAEYVQNYYNQFDNEIKINENNLIYYFCLMQIQEKSTFKNKNIKYIIEFINKT